MKNKKFLPGFLLMVIVVVVLLLVENEKKTIADGNTNPYELNYDVYKRVPDSLIAYTETKRFKLDGISPRAIVINKDTIFVAIDQTIQLVNLKGEWLQTIELNAIPNALCQSGDQLVVAFKDYYSIMDLKGIVAYTSPVMNEKTIITSVLVQQGNIVLADAGMRMVYAYDPQGEMVFQTNGKRNKEDLHGFIIPSPYFDMSLDPAGDLWIVNPGQHALENYGTELAYKANWANASFQLDGFSGCCNPAHIRILPDGSFITSEKGMVRIKIYSPDGQLRSVVAPPSKFKDEGHAPDLAVDSNGRIYALDYDANTIRVFEKKK
jgi:DNA-binding beta-propeller fold protein YncE